MQRTLLTLATALPLLASAQSVNKPKIALHNWATGISSPVCVTNCGDSRLFVVEQAGRIKIIADSMNVLATPFLDIHSEVVSGGEQGLLGLAFEPDYADSGYFYVYYIANIGSSGTSRISRFHVSSDPDVADPTSEQVLWSYPQPASNHNGGDLHFGPDGNLYLGLGDGGGGNDTYSNGQDLTDPLGGLIRIDVSQHNDTFAIPPDNPFVNAGGDTLHENWMWGLRNPWRWSFDRLTGDVWIGDVGQNAWEEIDFWPAGDNSGPNFGWVCREGLVATPGVSQANCQPASAYESPVGVYAHSTGWVAIIGGYVYRGTQYPHLYGHYMFTDYSYGSFLTYGPGYDPDTLLTGAGAGFSSFGEGSDGSLYVCNLNNSRVQKIYDPCPMEDPTITNNGDWELESSPATSYQWFLNGIPVPGATDQVYVPTVGGNYQVRANYGSPCNLFSDTLLFVATSVPEHLRPELVTFPQPAVGGMIVERSNTATAATFEVVDAMGRVVLSSNWPQGQTQLTVDVSDLTNGGYVGRLLPKGQGSVSTVHLMIAH